MKGRLRFTNFSFNTEGFDADCEVLVDAPPAVTPVPAPVPVPVPPPAPPPPPAPEPTSPPVSGVFPVGYNSDPNVAFGMLTHAMDVHGLTPVGVQNHGQQIIDALNETWPGLNVYLSPSDAPVWPGFGSVDVTISSGLGGWSFRPDGVTPYAR